MIAITEKTLQDLQFPTVLETLSDICNTDIGKEKALKITPFKEKETLMEALLQTSEYVSSFQNNNAIPDNIIWLSEEDQQLTRNSGVGLGLESVHGLALELGGRFEVEIVDSYWVNKITLPVRPVKKEQKSAA